jgi:hypothetical protein
VSTPYEFLYDIIATYIKLLGTDIFKNIGKKQKELVCCYGEFYIVYCRSCNKIIYFDYYRETSPFYDFADMFRYFYSVCSCGHSNIAVSIYETDATSPNMLVLITTPHMDHIDTNINIMDASYVIRSVIVCDQNFSLASYIFTGQHFADLNRSIFSPQEILNNRLTKFAIFQKI